MTAMTTTSLERTYRNLRVGIAATVASIAVSVAIASISMGELWPSISSYYYSAARGPFVGALIAASLGIIAISGRGLERVLLDAAGLLAPVIALVPTPYVPGTLPGYVPCLPSNGCSPTIEQEVDVGILTYAAIGLVVCLVALALGRTTASVIVALGILLTVLAFWLFARDVLLTWGHLLAAGAFFLVIAAVAFLSIFPVAGERDPSAAVRRGYLVIGIAMVADVVVLVIAAAGGGSRQPVVFVLEFIALGLFVAFWLLQSTRKWNDPDPSLRMR